MYSSKVILGNLGRVSDKKFYQVVTSMRVRNEIYLCLEERKCIYTRKQKKMKEYLFCHFSRGRTNCFIQGPSKSFVGGRGRTPKMR